VHRGATTVRPPGSSKAPKPSFASREDISGNLATDSPTPCPVSETEVSRKRAAFVERIRRIATDLLRAGKYPSRRRVLAVMGDSELRGEGLILREVRQAMLACEGRCPRIVPRSKFPDGDFRKSEVEPRVAATRIQRPGCVLESQPQANYTAAMRNLGGRTACDCFAGELQDGPR